MNEANLVMIGVFSSDNHQWRSFEMWITLAIVWLVGCVSLYYYLYATAAEAPQDKCFDCELPECSDCPHQIATVENKVA